MINTVDGHRIGDNFAQGGVFYEVTSFPTRSSVCGKNFNFKLGQASNCKLPISGVFWLAVPPRNE